METTTTTTTTTTTIKGKITPDPKEVFANWSAHVKEYKEKYVKK